VIRLRWALRLAWREARGAGRHMAYLGACVAVGVAALVGVGAFDASLERALLRSARSLVAADVEIRSTQPLSPGAEARLGALAREGVEVTRVRELAAMARTGASGPSLLVELKVVEPGYPFYGRLVTAPDLPLVGLVGAGRALVHESLLSRLGLRPGDRLRVGEADLRISGVILEEPDRAVGLFSLGPRVLIAAEDLDRTGLVRPGSRVRYRTLLRLPEGRPAETLRDALARELPDPGVRIAAFTEAQPGLRRFWRQVRTYLGLTGLVALMVGGIGVAVSVSAFVGSRVFTIAVLRCLGAGWQDVLAAYLLQTALLGLGGSLLGAALGLFLQPVLTPALARLVPLAVEPGWSAGAVGSGLAMGLGVTLLFALWPLLQIRRVPPAAILRSQVDPVPVGPRPWLAALPVAAGLGALALWQAGAWKAGGLFLGGLAGALGLLALVARGLVALARRTRWRYPAWRHGVAGLYRPGGHAMAVLVSLGLAVMLVVTVALLGRSVRVELGLRGLETAPAFFFIDIQPDQAAPLARLVADLAGGAPELVPVVRSRLAAIDGAPVTRDGRGRDGEAWYLTREYVLTWAAAPPGRNTVVAGRWWTPEEAAREPLVSVEEEIARSLGVGLGGTLTFDVQGWPVTARVASLRRVEWQSLGSNFFVIFSPGALDGAPMTYLATARVGPQDEGRVQSAVARAFPNVTAIPVREVLARVAGVVDQIASALGLVAGFSVATGLVVMAGALGVTRSRRLYESVLLRTLGATRGAVTRIFAVEYALLGGAAGLAGTALAAALAWAVLRFALDARWTWQPGTLALGVASAVGLALAVGCLATRRLLGQEPLRVLRER
jgi:putative ABC transport system permease protein